MRSTDHRNLDLTQLNLDVLHGTAGGKVIWQPRILCWLADRQFLNTPLPGEYEGLDARGLYKALGCSDRLYQYTGVCDRIEPPSVRRYSKKLSEYETEHVLETPAGRATLVNRSNSSNPGVYPVKWWIEREEDIDVFIWLEENVEYKLNLARYNEIAEYYKGMGAPHFCMPRVNIQHLFVDMMGTENTLYALCDYPDRLEAYFKVRELSEFKMMRVLNESPVEVINFGDNVHSKVLSPRLFHKYVLPCYQRRNEFLHRAGKFTHAHWDGDTRELLPFAKESGLDGLEAVTPAPQGDVTVAEMRELMHEDVFLLDGLAAVLFGPEYPVEALKQQVREVLEAFAPRLVLGISDELPSHGIIDRVRIVGDMVDDYNAKL